MAIATQIHQSSTSVRSTPRRPAREVWQVSLTTTDIDGDRLTFKFELDCRRGMFFQALRKYLGAQRVSGNTIEGIIENHWYSRHQIDEYRVPEQPLFTPIED